MTLFEHQLDHQECLRLAAQALGEPVRAVTLDWKMEQILRKHIRHEKRLGIGPADAMVRIQSERKGHALEVGLEVFRVDRSGVRRAGCDSIRVVKVDAPYGQNNSYHLYSFWAVPIRDYRPLYRLLRRELRRDHTNVMPVMCEHDRRSLWDNSVGFLKQGCELLAEFGVAQKRGILLLGEPGNGKTMACRWLRAECERSSLEWRSVSAEEYGSSREDGEAHELFHLDRPGIVCFDDLDMALRDREQFGHSADHSTFLAAMDGIEVEHGVVYIFTSNSRLVDLDPAFRRPGRIDLVLNFSRPDSELRRRLIGECWHPDVVRHIKLDDAVRQTEGLSFAEMEEVKKLMVLNYLECGDWNWPRAWEAFESGCEERDSRRSFGFNRPRVTATTCAVSISH
jgi:hypothetical protein